MKESLDFEIQNSLVKLLERDLSKLAKEVELYKKEENLWLVVNDIKNSAGNLCLHLTGNLNHFVGTVIGETNFMRNRHGEFHDKDIPRSDLLQMIDDCIKTMKEVIPTISEKQMLDEYPIQVFGRPMKTIFFLLHLAGHLNYHLGQINYHRRLLEN